MTPEERRALLDQVALDLAEPGAQDDDPWADVAAGRISAESLPDDDDLAALAREALEPLGSAFQEQVVHAALKGLEPTPAEAPPPAPWWRSWLAVVPVLAAAGALFTLLQRPPAPLPNYSLEVAGWRATDRAEPGEAGVLSTSGALELSLRPASRAEGHVELGVWALRGDSVSQVGSTSTRSGGTLTVRIPGSGLGAPGRLELVMLLGRDALQANPQQPGSHLQRFTRVVTLLP